MIICSPAGYSSQIRIDGWGGKSTQFTVFICLLQANHVNYQCPPGKTCLLFLNLLQTKNITGNWCWSCDMCFFLVCCSWERFSSWRCWVVFSVMGTSRRWNAVVRRPSNCVWSYQNVNYRQSGTLSSSWFHIFNFNSFT